MRLVVLAVLALLLTACGGGAVSAPADPPELPASSAPTAEAAESQPAKPATNERGHLVKELGEEAGFGDGDSAVAFAIDKIEVDPDCQAYGVTPESGHTLLLHVRVATGSDPEMAMATAGVVNPFNFVEIGSDGVTSPADVGSCADYESNLASNFGVNQQYRGTIEIVVPEASGVLALATHMQGSGGWEWHY
jgi:hypothetical protein